MIVLYLIVVWQKNPVPNGVPESEINLDKSIVKIAKGGLYLSQAEKNKIIAALAYTENNLFKQDQDFLDFLSKKNNLESTYYNIKNLIQNKNLTNNNFNGKNIMTCLQEIEDQINGSYNKIFDLSPIEDSLNKIMKSITPNNVESEKQRILNDVNDYQKKIDEGKIKLEQKEMNDAVNMLDYFKKQLYLAIDMKEIQNLKKEFNTEKRKYF